MYEPLETSKCKKCGKIIAEPKELIRSVKDVHARLKAFIQNPLDK